MIYVQLSQDGVVCCLRLFAFVFCGVYQRGRAGSSSVERRLPFRPRVAVLVLAWTLLFSSSSFSALSVLGPRPGGSGACLGTHSPALLSALGGGGGRRPKKGKPGAGGRAQLDTMGPARKIQVALRNLYNSKPLASCLDREVLGIKLYSPPSFL